MTLDDIMKEGKKERRKESKWSIDPSAEKAQLYRSTGIEYLVTDK